MNVHFVSCLSLYIAVDFLSLYTPFLFFPLPSQTTVGKKENGENELSDDENQKSTPKKKGKIALVKVLVQTRCHFVANQLGHRVSSSNINDLYF